MAVEREIEGLERQENGWLRANIGVTIEEHRENGAPTGYILVRRTRDGGFDCAQPFDCSDQGATEAAQFIVMTLGVPTEWYRFAKRRLDALPLRALDESDVEMIAGLAAGITNWGFRTRDGTLQARIGGDENVDDTWMCTVADVRHFVEHLLAPTSDDDARFRDRRA